MVALQTVKVFKAILTLFYLKRKKKKKCYKFENCKLWLIYGGIQVGQYDLENNVVF